MPAPPSVPVRAHLIYANRDFLVSEKARFTHVIAFFALDVSEKRFITHGKTTERGNVAKKSLRFHARFYNSLKINFPGNQS